MSNKDFTPEEKKIMQIAANISTKTLDYLTKIQPYEIQEVETLFNKLSDQGQILFWGKILTNIVSPLVKHLSENTNYTAPEILNLLDMNLRRVFETKQ